MFTLRDMSLCLKLTGFVENVGLYVLNLSELIFDLGLQAWALVIPSLAMTSPVTKLEIGQI